MSELTPHSHGKGVQSELAPITRELRQVIPDTYSGFAALHGAALAEGRLKSEPPKKQQLKLSGGYLPHGRRPCNDLWPTGLLCIL